MQQQTSLYIPKPCHENWNEMTPTQQGKFCAACSKQVVDFSLMSDTQILNYLSGQSGKVCGRFDAEQLERPLIETKFKKKKSWWMAAFMPLFLMNNKSSYSNAIIPVTDTTIQPSQSPMVTMGVILESIPGKSNITGTVHDETGTPLSHVSVIEKGTRNGTVTDSDGNFLIDVHSKNNNVTLVISNVGYETVERTIDLNGTANINIDMCLSETVTKGLTEIIMGKMVVGESQSAIDTVKSAIQKICGISRFKIFPNPAVQGSAVHLEIKQPGAYQVQLFDNQSRLVATEAINVISNKSVSDITLPSGITTGVYYLRLVNEQTRKSYTEKLIIQ